MATPRIYDVQIPHDTDHDEGLALAREKASGVGITLEGDTDKGTFSGVAAGTYQRQGDRLRFEIRKKPFFITWGIIEAQMRKVFEDVQVL